jgi:hypothetical protein
MDKSGHSLESVLRTVHEVKEVVALNLSVSPEPGPSVPSLGRTQADLLVALVLFTGRTDDESPG